MRTLTWSDTRYAQPAPPVAWAKQYPEHTWILVNVQRPHGQPGPRRWCFELQPPVRDEWSAEWLRYLEVAA